jgi:predicted DNA-binding transcriptional regulator YafY
LLRSSNAIPERCIGTSKHSKLPGSRFTPRKWRGLIGYCHLRKEVRVFALDRIKMLHQTKESFEVAEDFDFEDFMKPSFGVYQGKLVKVRIWFSPDAAGYIKEKIWHDTQEILPQKDGSIVFEAEVAGTEEIKFWVMSWGSKAEVLESQSLREEIRAESEALLGKYGEHLLIDEKPSVA